MEDERYLVEEERCPMKDRVKRSVAVEDGNCYIVSVDRLEGRLEVFLALDGEGLVEDRLVESSALLGGVVARGGVLGGSMAL